MRHVVHPPEVPPGGRRWILAICRYMRRIRCKRCSPPPAAGDPEGITGRRANIKAMAELTASRTLVKSSPELWAECSDAASLARHLGAFGEIRITRLEPETAVAWEGEDVRGTVTLEPSGWGTRVVLTADAAEQTRTSPVTSPSPRSSLGPRRPDRGLSRPVVRGAGAGPGVEPPARAAGGARRRLASKPAADLAPETPAARALPRQARLQSPASRPSRGARGERGERGGRVRPGRQSVRRSGRRCWTASARRTAVPSRAAEPRSGRAIAAGRPPDQAKP